MLYCMCQHAADSRISTRRDSVLAYYIQWFSLVIPLGRAGGSRTHMESPPADFKSACTGYPSIADALATTSSGPVRTLKIEDTTPGASGSHSSTPPSIVMRQSDSWGQSTP